MDINKFKSIGKGLITYFPGAYQIIRKIKPKGGHSSSNAKFCYSFWLRILVTINELDLNNSKKCIAEIGPANSFGIGICALLCGAEKYIALDIDDSYDSTLTTGIFEELLKLLISREPIPDDIVFPNINLRISNYDFPKDILNDELLDKSLSKDRINQILMEIQNVRGKNNVFISYYTPWQSNTNLLQIKRQNIDLIFSRAVLEHVKFPIILYKDINTILRKSMLMFHDIEYHSHGLSKYWNGHRHFSKLTWKIVNGNRPYFLNKVTHSEHEDLITGNRFKILRSDRIKRDSNLRRGIYGMSVDDYETYGGAIVSTKI